MKYERAAFAVSHIWSSPFVRWQGALADVSSIHLAAAVSDDALARGDVDRAAISRIVLGSTVPQSSMFYGAPWIAARLGMPSVTGAQLAQACATSVACVVDAAKEIEGDTAAVSLVVTSDRTSNGPFMIWPQSQAAGGQPETSHWVLDAFACDPNTGESMLSTAEHVAREGAMSREALDDLVMLRWSQYERALADDRRFQRRYMVPFSMARKRDTLEVAADEGVHSYSAARLSALKAPQADGVVTHGGQTHPADGSAGVVLGDVDRVRSWAGAGPVAQLVSSAFTRAEPARMPKAATLAAQQAAASAGLEMHEFKFVTTHNPFAVNDLWLHQQTGYPLEKMNPYGCSLIYGHPQAPTGLRGIAELAHALAEAGGGYGMFTGCAAGDTGAALVLKVD